MRDLLNQVRWVAFVAVATLLGVFIFQNAAEVELQLFEWSVTSRRAFVVLAFFCIGFLIGLLFGQSARRR